METQSTTADETTRQDSATKLSWGLCELDWAIFWCLESHFVRSALWPQYSTTQNPAKFNS